MDRGEWRQEQIDEDVRIREGFAEHVEADGSVRRVEDDRERDQQVEQRDCLRSLSRRAVAAELSYPLFCGAELTIAAQPPSIFQSDRQLKIPLINHRREI